MSYEPTTIIRMYGDIPQCKQQLGVARSQLKILENQMQFQSTAQGWRKRRINGAEIHVTRSFGLRIISIFTGGNLKKETDCWCGCHLSVGQVRFREGHDPLAHLCAETRYDVRICMSRSALILMENVPSASRDRYWCPRRYSEESKKYFWDWGEQVTVVLDLQQFKDTLSEEAEVAAQTSVYDEVQAGCTPAAVMIVPLFVPEFAARYLDYVDIEGENVAAGSGSSSGSGSGDPWTSI